MANAALVGIVAGEASGDTLGAHLMSSLRARRPDLRFVGIGGPKMIAAGFESWHSQERLAVRGLVEVVRHIRELYAIRRDVVTRMLAARPAIFIGIDSPDFNLGLELRLRRRGLTTAHYVSPSVWAWRAGRIRTIARAVDHMLVLFPFEAAVYERAGIKVSYVGHPLADETPLEPPRASARAALNIPDDCTVVAMLPGSRLSELSMMAAPFIGAAQLIHARRPDIRIVVPLATPATKAVFEQTIVSLRAGKLSIDLLSGQAQLALASADVILVASGTATLEAALAKRPLVVAYRLAPLTYWLAKRLVKIPFIALPNILDNEFLVPEFIQDAATPNNLAQAVLNALDDPRLAGRLAPRFESLHQRLRCNTAERAADALIPYLNA